MDHGDGACWIAIGAGVGLLLERSGIGTKAGVLEVGAAQPVYSDTRLWESGGTRGEVSGAAIIQRLHSREVTALTPARHSFQGGAKKKHLAVIRLSA